MNQSTTTQTASLIEVRTEDAPSPVGPYSQAIRIHPEQDEGSGGLVFVSGQIPLDPRTGKLAAGEIEDETRQVLANLKAVLEASGASLASVVKATVYLTDMSLFPRMNAIYAEAFDSDPSPARATVAVSALPLGANVEIDAIARCLKPSSLSRVPHSDVRVEED